MKKIIYSISISIGMLLLLTVPGRAEWVQDGSTFLNINGNESAFAPHIGSDQGGTYLPQVTWSEFESGADQIYVSKWETAVWTQQGASLNRVNTQTACAPRIIVDNTNTPYITWLEQNIGFEHELFVSFYSGAIWNPMGEKINIDTNSNAHSPDIILSGLTPVVCWQDENVGAHKIKVARYNSTVWDPMGTELNFDGNYNAFRPRMVIYGSDPFVTWYEESSGETQVYVKKWNATFWELAGTGSLNMDVNESAQNPDIAIELSTPYVVWDENTVLRTEIYVKRLNMTVWQQVGTGSLNISVGEDAHSAGITLFGGTPFVAWCESDGNTTQVYVKKFTGSNWEPLGGSLNMDGNYGAKDPSITVVNGTPYVTWEEWDASYKSRIYVKHWDDIFFTKTATLTMTSTPTMVVTETHSPTPEDPSLTYTPTGTPTIFSLLETLTPTVTYVADESPTPALTQTVTPTERKRKPHKGAPVVIRSNVLKPSTRRPMQIAVYLEQAGRIKVKIYSMRGKLIKTLVDEVVQAGNFETVWEGVNKNGSVVRSGIYIVYIETEHFKEKRKMVVIR